MIIWPTNLFFEKFTRCAKVCGLLFFLIVFLWMLIGWVDKLRSRGRLEQDAELLTGNHLKVRQIEEQVPWQERLQILKMSNFHLFEQTPFTIFNKTVIQSKEVIQMTSFIQCHVVLVMWFVFRNDQTRTSVLVYSEAFKPQRFWLQFSQPVIRQIYELCWENWELNQQWSLQEITNHFHHTVLPITAHNITGEDWLSLLLRIEEHCKMFVLFCQ